MLKTIYLPILLVLFTLVGCGPSDDSMGPEVVPEDFNIQLTASNNAVVDEVVSVRITSSKPMASLTISFDNFQTSTTAFSDLGSTQTRFFRFDKVGTETTIYLRAKDEDGNESDITYTPTINRGNSIKINQVQIVSFNGINTTLDPEFPAGDPNRLGDIFFVLRKFGVNLNDGTSANRFNWYTSPIKENQGDLTYDLSSENVNIDPQTRMFYAMADDDGNFVEDLMQGPPFEREFNFSDFAATRPEQVRFEVPEINLEVVFTVDWN